MKFFDRICEALTRALGLTALSPWADNGVSQRPLQTPVIQEALFQPAMDRPSQRKFFNLLIHGDPSRSYYLRAQFSVPQILTGLYL